MKDYTLLLLLIIFIVALFVSSCTEPQKLTTHVDKMSLHGSQLFYGDTLVRYNYYVNVKCLLDQKEEIDLIKYNNSYYLQEWTVL